LKDKPELFTVQVTLVWAVFNPIASLLARAVVRALWLPTIVWLPPAPVERERVTPFRLVKASLPTVPEVPASETVQLELVTVGTV